MREDRDGLLAEACQQLFGLAPEVIREAREATQSDGEGSIVDVLVARGALDAYEQDILRQLTDKLYDPEACTLLAESLVAGESVALDLEFLQLQEEERYLSLKEHDRGGMGRIVTVWDRRMNREVARKELLSRHTESGSGSSSSEGKRRRMMGRFLREAQVTGRLQHPSIVPVYEIGRRDDGTVYYTMKFVRGRTLERAIRAAGDTAGRLELLPHFVDLCQAVAYAHSQGVIHRDLKPANVMIGEFGETYLVDWGLAKFLMRHDVIDGDEEGTGEGGGDLDNLTADGEVMGTPHYMPPEQAAGKLRELDERSDIYALGAVLYHLLTGERPFDGLSRMKVLSEVLQAEPLAPDKVEPDVPPALAAICRRAMELDPAQRYPTARELAAEVQRYESGGRVAAHDYGRVELMRRFLKRHRPVVATSLVALGVLMGVVVYAFLAVSERAEAEREARLHAERTTNAMAMNDAYRQLVAFDQEAVHLRLEDFPTTWRGWPWGHLFYTSQVRFTRMSQHGGLGPGEPRPDYSNIDMTADGRHLLTADDSGCVNWWSTVDDRIVSTVQTHGTKLLDAKIHPDDAHFASAAFDGEVCVWEIETGARVAQITIVGEARELDFSADGEEVLVAGPGGVTVWNWRAGETTGMYWGDGDQMNTVEVSADGAWVAAGDEIGMVYLWNRQSGARTMGAMAHPRADTGDYWGVLDVSFRPGHGQFATSGSDGTVRIWNYAGEPVDVFARFERKIWSVNWFSDGSRFIAMDQSDLAHIQLADSRVPKGYAIKCSGAQEVSISPDGTRLSIASHGQRVLSVRPHENGGQFLEGHRSGLNDVCFSRDGRQLYSVAGRESDTYDNRVLSWEVVSNTHMPRWHPHSDVKKSEYYPVLKTAAQPAIATVLFDGLEKRGKSLALHPVEEVLAVGDGGGTVWFLALPDGTVQQRIDIPDWEEGIRSLAFSVDGKELVVAGWGSDSGQSARIFDVATRNFLRTIGHHAREITHVDWDPQNRYIATGARDRVLALWDSATGNSLRQLEKSHGRADFAFSLSHDGSQIITDAPAILRPFQAAPIVQIFTERSGRRNAGSLSLGGECVVVASTSETVVYDAQSAVLLFSLPHGASRAKFSPDGRTLATAGLDGRVGLWHSLPWE